MSIVTPRSAETLEASSSSRELFCLGGFAIALAVVRLGNWGSGGGEIPFALVGVGHGGWWMRRRGWRREGGGLSGGGRFGGNKIIQIVLLKI